MTKGLREGVAMPIVYECAGAIRGDDLLISLLMGFFQPAQQGRPEIETDRFVIVCGGWLARCGIGSGHKGVGLITLEMNPLVPVVKRSCARLCLNDVGPGIFARRLIEVTVN